MLQFGYRGADYGAGSRNVFAPVADDVGGVEDQQEYRNEAGTPVAPQVKAMQPHEAGAKPEHVGDEQRWALGTPFRSWRCTNIMATIGNTIRVPQ